MYISARGIIVNGLAICIGKQFEIHCFIYCHEGERPSTRSKNNIARDALAT